MFVQMPSLSVSSYEFEVVLENLNTSLITPILLDLELISHQDKNKIESKPQKQAVKLVLKSAKHHPDGAELFQHALERSREYEGHRKILAVLYHQDDDLTIQGTILASLCTIKE